VFVVDIIALVSGNAQVGMLTATGTFTAVSDDSSIAAVLSVFTDATAAETVVLVEVENVMSGKGTKIASSAASPCTVK